MVDVDGVGGGLAAKVAASRPRPPCRGPSHPYGGRRTMSQVRVGGVVPGSTPPLLLPPPPPSGAGDTVHGAGGTQGGSLPLGTTPPVAAWLA